MTAPALLVSALLPWPAAAQPTPSVVAQAPAQRPRYLGAGLDVGNSGVLPDVGVMVTYRPRAWLNVAAGAGHNLVSPGIKGGLTLVSPLYAPISLTVEYGHYFQGNANGWAKRLSSQKEDIASLKKVGYGFTNLLLGVQFGTPRFVFHARAGYTFMSATVRDFDETLRGAGAAATPSTTDPHLSYFGPALKLGMTVFFL